MKSGFLHGAIVVILFLLSSPCISQEAHEWKGKSSAVCLTYDDALNVHLDKVIPMLDSLGLKATFYLSGSFQTIKDRTEDWKKAAQTGHELGNHSLFHPCRGDMPGREWVKADYDLSTYSPERMADEISMNNVVLNLIDNKKQRTFAYPCGDMTAGGASYVETIKSNFIAARGVRGKMEKLISVDLFDIGSFMINGQNGSDLINLVNEAVKANSLVVFLFHGVGGEHSLNVSLEAHAELLKYLKENEKNIWIAPLADIAEWIKNEQGNSSH